MYLVGCDITDSTIAEAVTTTNLGYQGRIIIEGVWIRIRTDLVGSGFEKKENGRTRIRSEHSESYNYIYFIEFYKGSF